MSSVLNHGVCEFLRLAPSFSILHLRYSQVLVASIDFFLFYCQFGFFYMDVPISLSTYLLKEIGVVFSFWRWWMELMKKKVYRFWGEFKSGDDESYGKCMVTILRHWKMVLQKGCTILNLQGNVWVLYCFIPLPALGVPGFYFFNFSYFTRVGGSVSSWIYFVFSFNGDQFANFLSFYRLYFYCHI